jgi:hypothetical protein
MRTWTAGPLLGLALVLLPGVGTAAERAAPGKDGLRLSAAQKDTLWMEPLLVALRAEGAGGPALPAGLGKGSKLRFEITPAVKARPAAKPLPLEAQVPDARARVYDLTEWFLFPEKGGTWTVQAVLEQGGHTLRSAPVTVSIRKPAKDDGEFQPMARIHHPPWTNYEANAFCGDTFDVVKRWPSSRFAKYCHYWNGRHLQHKKDCAKALESFRTVVEKYPDFALADHAAYGVVECLVAQKKYAEAATQNAALRRRLAARGDQSAVRKLADALAQRLEREVSAAR